MHILSPLFVVFILIAALPASAADDLPQPQEALRPSSLKTSATVRENNRINISPENGPPVAWSIDTIGLGFSSVVVGSGTIFTQGTLTQGPLKGVEHVIAIDESTGNQLWATCPEEVRKYIKSRIAEEKARLDTDGDTTSLSEAEALPRFSHLMRVTGDGNRKLTDDELQSFFGGFHHPAGDGPRGTPTIAGEFVYALSGNGDLSCLEVKTGNEVWYKSLIRDFDGTLPVWGYADSPHVTEKEVVVIPGGKEFAVLTLDRRTGNTIRRLGRVDDSSAVLDRQATQFVENSVVVGDYVYTAPALGLECIHRTTGKAMWQVQGVGKGSICATDGMLIVVGENHEVLFAEATPSRYVERGRFTLPNRGRPLWSRPVVAKGHLYVRDQQFLTSYTIDDWFN